MFKNLTSDKKRYDDGIMGMQEHKTDQLESNLIEHENACLATLR